VGRDIMFTGRVDEPATLARWLFASDACVSPGPLGLSVVDCLFAGVAVISHDAAVDGPHHGPEWRYLTPGVTGYFASANTDDALATVCREYLSRSTASRDQIRRTCAAQADEHLGIAKMAGGMLSVIEAIRDKSKTEAPPRS